MQKQTLGQDRGIVFKKRLKERYEKRKTNHCIQAIKGHNKSRNTIWGPCTVYIVKKEEDLVLYTQ